MAWTAALAAVAVQPAASAVEPAASLGVRLVVQPPETGITQTLEGALLSRGNPVPVALRIQRSGRAITIRNEKAEFVCDVRLEAAAEQSCFSKRLVVDAVLPLSRLGPAAHPFVMTATIGDWPVAIFAGLDGIAAADRCKRFISTISQSVRRLADAICPNPGLPASEPVEGLSLTYESGSGATLNRYTMQPRPENPALPSHILGSLVRCATIAKQLFKADQDLSCSRSERGMAWRDTLSFIGTRTLQDDTVTATLKAYRLTIVGTSENTHRSVVETEIWLEAGVPYRTRYLVQAGRGPDGLGPKDEYTETLRQVTLPAP